MEASILVDTSAWIAFFAPGGHSALKSDLGQALRAERVCTCAVVATELLVGARDRAAFRTLRALLNALPDVPINADRWAGAARLGFSLRRDGMTIPLSDLVIAELCRAHSLELWHLDRHYEAIQSRTRIQTRSFLQA